MYVVAVVQFNPPAAAGHQPVALGKGLNVLIWLAD